MSKKSNVINMPMDQIREFSVPEATASHNPIPYGDLRDSVVSVADSLLTPAGYTLYKENYKARDDGSQMFGTITWSDGSSSDMGFSVGIRSSYDKTIAAGLVMGSQVFVCSNMMFNGDIKIMRKNTTNCITDIKQSILLALYGCKDHYTRFRHLVESWREKIVGDREAEDMFGHCLCRDILKPQQLTEALRQWRRPFYDDFKKRSVFSLYNSMNIPLKEANPISIIESHTKLNMAFEERYAI